MPTKTGSDRPRGTLGSRTSAMSPATIKTRVTPPKPNRNRNRVQSQARSHGRKR
jgi:hypothetical protein